MTHDDDGKGRLWTAADEAARTHGLDTAVGFLARLRRLVEIRRYRDHELNDKGIRLVENMIVRSYQDCLEVGAMREAQAIVEVLRG